MHGQDIHWRGETGRDLAKLALAEHNRPEALRMLHATISNIENQTRAHVWQPKPWENLSAEDHRYLGGLGVLPLLYMEQARLVEGFIEYRNAMIAWSRWVKAINSLKLTEAETALQFNPERLAWMQDRLALTSLRFDPTLNVQLALLAEQHLITPTAQQYHHD